MRYFKWKIDWSDPNYGTDPTGPVNDKGSRLESCFSGSDNWIYGYLVEGEPNILDFELWYLTEITSVEMLEVAIEIDNLANIQNGKIIFPSMNPNPYETTE